MWSCKVSGSEGIYLHGKRSDGQTRPVSSGGSDRIWWRRNVMAVERLVIRVALGPRLVGKLTRFAGVRATRAAVHAPHLQHPCLADL
jgi:hypothetical protein